MQEKNTEHKISLPIIYVILIFQIFCGKLRIKFFFFLENSLYSKSVPANINKFLFDPSSEPLTKHTSKLLCQMLYVL